MLTVILEPFTLRAIERAKAEPRGPNTDYPALCDQIIEAGFAGAGMIEALFVSAGLPLAMCSFEIMKRFGFAPQFMFYRPNGNEDAFGFEHYTAAAIARFLIYARAVGVPIDPEPMARPLAWSLRGRAVVTEDELAVLRRRTNVEIEVREAA